MRTREARVTDDAHPERRKPYADDEAEQNARQRPSSLVHPFISDNFERARSSAGSFSMARSNI